MATTSSCVGVMCMGVLILVGSVASQDARDGSQKNLPIQSERPIINVLHIEFHPGFKVHVVAAADGPQAGETWTHTQAAALPPLIAGDFAGYGRTWADQRHITAENVPKLRPLIDRKLAEVAA